MQALERLMVRIGDWPPVIVVTPGFDADVARAAAADAGRRFPGEAGAAGRAGAHLRARRQGAPTPARPPRRRSTPSCPRSAAPASPRWRSRPRCCCSTAASARPDHRPAWSISISSTAPAPTISISSRGSISSEIEPRPERLDRQLLEMMLSHHPSGLDGDRGAEPAGRDAHASIPTW